MSFFNDTYCQLCERFTTKEEWKNHLYSSRHLHREANGYSQSYFPQRIQTTNEGSSVEKAFWGMTFANECCIQV